MSDKQDTSPKINTRSESSPAFRRIVVDQVFGRVDSVGLIATIVSERRDIEKAYSMPIFDPNEIIIKRTIECDLIIKPEQMKALYVWFGDKIDDYEAIYGKIPSPEEVKNKAAKYYKSKSDKQNLK